MNNKIIHFSDAKIFMVIRSVSECTPIYIFICVCVCVCVCYTYSHERICIYPCTYKLELTQTKTSQ